MLLAHSHSRSTSSLHDTYYQRDPSPRGVPRTTTWDYAGGHNSRAVSPSPGPGPYGTSPGATIGANFSHREMLDGGGDGAGADVPPAPLKETVSPDDWALIQEISRIDLDASRSTRRHRGY